MTLDWRYLHKGDMETIDGTYTITNATIWEHSRIVQTRYEAGFGQEHLGYFPTKWAAIDACEQHHKENQ